MAYGVFGVHFALLFRYFPLCKLAVKVFKFGLSQFLGYIRVDVQGCRNVRMSQRILNYLDVHTSFAHPSCECVPQSVTTETREENSTVWVFCQFFIVTVSDNASDCLVQRPLMLAFTKTVDEDEVRVAVHPMALMG